MGPDRHAKRATVNAPEGLAIRSLLLASRGFTHGFSLRTGGVSAPPFDSLNLGRALGDDPRSVAENHRRLAAALGYPADDLFEVSQVHGARVLEPGPDAVPASFRASEADALCSARAGVAIGVRTADCMPVLLADPVTGAVAAVHAGWRGAVAGVLPAAIAALSVRAGADPARLVVAILPHIRACCFEVGAEVVEQVRAVLPEEAARRAVVERSPRPHVDLSQLVRAQLHEAGVAAERIDDVAGCTCCEPDRFFSFRRDGADAGRHLAVIVAAPAHP